MLTASAPAPGPGTDLGFVSDAVAAVESSIRRFKFNTAIAALMNLQAAMAGRRSVMTSAEWAFCADTFILLLAPLAPHLAEELWSKRGGEFSVHFQKWPEIPKVAATSVTLVVQVNGKVRDRIQMPAGAADDIVIQLARDSAGAKRHLGHPEPARIIHQKGRVVNFVLGTPDA